MTLGGVMTLYEHYKEIGYWGLVFCLFLWLITGDFWEGE